MKDQRTYKIREKKWDNWMNSKTEIGGRKTDGF